MTFAVVGGRGSPKRTQKERGCMNSCLRPGGRGSPKIRRKLRTSYHMWKLPHCRLCQVFIDAKTFPICEKTITRLKIDFGNFAARTLFYYHHRRNEKASFVLPSETKTLTSNDLQGETAPSFSTCKICYGLGTNLTIIPNRERQSFQ